MLTERLDQYLTSLIAQNRIPGCGLIVRKGRETVYNKCHGMSDIETKTVLDENTVFPMASMTKLIISVGIMKLVEEGKLSLNDNLVKFFPAYPEEKKRVRIRHLLNHCSSLGQGEPSNQFVMQTFHIEDDLKTRTEKWADMPFDCELAESADYSALVNFDLLGRIIEIATGENLDTWLKKEILYPLGMTDTGYFLSEEQMSRQATCYHSEDGNLIAVSMNNPLFDMVTVRYGYTSGAAGIFSTLHDYDRFTTMLANRGELNGVRIITPESLDLMRTPNQLTDAECVPGCPWGLGFMVFVHPEKAGIAVEPGTFGWSGAVGTHMFVNLEKEISATFVVCMDDLEGAGSFISRGIETIVFEEI